MVGIKETHAYSIFAILTGVNPVRLIQFKLNHSIF